MGWVRALIKSPGSFSFNVIAAVFLLALLRGLITVPQWSWAPMLAAFLAAALSALIANFEYIDTFEASSSGIEAKTREVVQRAETALKELHDLAAMTGQLLVELIVGGGRWGGGPAAQKDAQKQRVIQALHAIRLPAKKIDEIANADRQWVIVDYCSGILHEPSKKMRSKTGAELANWNEFVEQTHKGYEKQRPEEIRAALDRFGVLGEWEKGLIEDYSYYLKNGQHRRPEVWADRDKWDKVEMSQ
jgi:hypothetical protein